MLKKLNTGSTEFEQVHLASSVEPNGLQIKSEPGIYSWYRTYIQFFLFLLLDQIYQFKFIYLSKKNILLNWKS